MKKWGRLLLWIRILTKRLWKRPSFLVILGLLPLMLLLLRVGVEREEHSMLSIAIVQENEADSFSFDNSSVVQFKYLPREDAMASLTNGTIDAVWVIPHDFTKRLRDMIAHGWREKHACIEVWQREDNVLLQMSKVKLYGSLYEDISYELYRSFMMREMEVEKASIEFETQMKELYEKNHVSGTLFRYAYSKGYTQEDQPDYLLSPMRGFLALWMMLCGIVGAIYWKKDCLAGTFAHGLSRKNHLFGIACQLLVVIHGALAAYLALLVLGIGQSALWEAMLLLLYAVNIVMFCNILHLFIRRPSWYAICGGLLLVLEGVVCPLFFRIEELLPVSRLLPTHYYVSAIHNRQMAYYAVGYLFVLVLLNLFLSKITVCRNYK